MKNIVSEIKNAIIYVASAIWHYALYVILAIWNYTPFAATRGYILNKWVSLVALALMMKHYHTLQDQPFLELYYCAITVFGVALLGPLLRLILFTEASHYAETGGLTKDRQNNEMTVNLFHYWYATTISYLIPVLCFCTIAK